jgi:sugar (pentulose or hexulose) kinase
VQVRFAFNMDHSEITALAAKEPPGCRGVTFLPYMGGERTPNWPHATGAVLGAPPSPSSLEVAALLTPQVPLSCSPSM